MEAARQGIGDKGKELRSIPMGEGPTWHETKKAADARKGEFRREWLETLTCLGKIGEQLTANRPAWITETQSTSLNDESGRMGNLWSL